VTNVRVSAWFEPTDTQVEGYYDDDGTPWAVVEFDAFNGARLAPVVRTFEQVKALETALDKVRVHLMNDRAARDAA
jgi:hypothetical protein